MPLTRGDQTRKGPGRLHSFRLLELTVSNRTRARLFRFRAFPFLSFPLIALPALLSCMFLSQSTPMTTRRLTTSRPRFGTSRNVRPESCSFLGKVRQQRHAEWASAANTGRLPDQGCAMTLTPTPYHAPDLPMPSPPSKPPATALLERTRLHVRVHCQAIHAKNARHMLIDLIDYIQPVLVIIGSRGLSKLKGIILGSVSHYLIQKSSSPVMVTRKRLRPLNTRPRRPISDLQRQPRVGGLENATIDKESHGAMVPSHEQKMAAAGTGSGTAAAQSTRTAGGSDAATDSLNSSATALAITDSTEDVNART